MDSAELGKHSLIQSVSLDKKALTLGLTTIDGRCNISDIDRANTGLRLDQKLHLKLTKRKHMVR